MNDVNTLITKENADLDTPIATLVKDNPKEQDRLVNGLPHGIHVQDIVENFNFNTGQAIGHLIESSDPVHKRKHLAKAKSFIQAELDRMDRYGDHVQ